MPERQDMLHMSTLVADLEIPLERGKVILPAGAVLSIAAIVHEPERRGQAILDLPPDLVIEYRVLVVAESIRVLS